MEKPNAALLLNHLSKLHHPQFLNRRPIYFQTLIFTQEAILLSTAMSDFQNKGSGETGFFKFSGF